MNMNSKDFNRLLCDEWKTLTDMNVEARDIGCAKFIDNYPAFGEKLTGAVREQTDRQIDLLKRCKESYADLCHMIERLTDMRFEVESVAQRVVNSFGVEYDCDMFWKAHQYQGKFILKREHWSFHNAKEEYKADYDRCFELFKRITAGLDVHNFFILLYKDGSHADIKFTVAGVPGDFEIGFPLNSKEYAIEKPRLNLPDGRLPMQMTLTWRREWVIPHRDYFFNRFGTYRIDDLGPKIKEFIESKEYMKYCNTESYESTKTGPDGNEMKVTTFYDDDTKKGLEDALAKEIEMNGKEGKYR